MLSSRLGRWLVLLSVTAAAIGGGYVLTRDDASPPAEDRQAAVAGADPTVATVDVPEAERTGGTPVATEPPADVVTDAPVPESTDGSAGVTLAYAGWDERGSLVEVAGVVDGVDGVDGTCTATLTSGASSVTVSAAAVPNGPTVACGGLAVPGDRLTSGTWSAVLSYDSPTASGASRPVPVEVP